MLFYNQKGGISMECIMELPSVTYAQKAKIYLRENGISSEVIRSKGSCGYSIAANAECSRVKAVLDMKNIPYKEKNMSS